jgi:cytidyltransferase-like protein
MTVKIKNNFSWKKKSSIYIGRFQPFHTGHENLFKRGIKSSGQVVFLVMDSYKFNKKNPFTFSEVKKNISRKLVKYKNQFIVINIHMVIEIIYGRKVGYKIKKIKLSKKLESISATKIRRSLFK